jgi:O-glycosyl hydrolase
MDGNVCDMLRLLGLAWIVMIPCSPATAESRLRINPAKQHQNFEGMGCGAIFYEAHINSLSSNSELQEKLYDEMFKEVRTDYLQLMIRHDHEPVNDNPDPYLPQFNPEWFAYAKQTIAICKAARARNPKIRFHATLYTPPAWMKTNNDPSGGGEARATLKPGMENELAEYAWAFLEHLQKAGFPIEFLSIANEPDWPHDQPGYNLTPKQHAELVRSVDRYFKEMSRRFPRVPQVKLVGPNTLSALDCAERWVPYADRAAPGAIAVIGTHDYDRRGERFLPLRKLAGRRSLWVTEWCVNGVDTSPGLIHSASQYWLAMTEAFNQGVNTWMAYDWVYPPRQGGEALIHLDWGNSYSLTKIYHGFRQWCAPLTVGMKVVSVTLSGQDATGISKAGIKAAAFITPDGKRLVAHVANVQDRSASLVIDPGPRFMNARVRRVRTSATEDAVKLPDAAPTEWRAPMPLAPQSLHTWEWTID